MAKLSIVEFGPDVLEAYKLLFRGDETKVPERLVQRFASHPHGRSRFAVAHDEEGKALGLIALLPTSLCTSTGSLEAYQAIDTIVAPEARGKAIFVRLGKLIHDTDCLGKAIWGFPNALAARGWFSKRLAWRNFGQVPFLFRPLRTGFMFKRAHPALAFVNFPIPIPATEVEYSEGFNDAEYDVFWRLISVNLGTTVDRSAAWLRWRLGNGKPYRVITAREGSHIVAMVITLIEEKHGAKIAYVMEAQSRDPATGIALLRSELRRAQGLGADLALAWCFGGSPNHMLYRGAGFWPLPQRIRPVEINFGGRALAPQAELIFDKGSVWFLSYLDSDTV